MEPTPITTPAPVPIPAPAPAQVLLQLQYVQAKAGLIDVLAPLHALDFISLLQELLLILQHFIYFPTLILVPTASLTQPPYSMLLLQHFQPQHPSDQVRLNALNYFPLSLQATHPHLLLFLHALLNLFAPL